MTNLLKLSFVISCLIFISGCTMSTVEYQPDFQLVNELKDKNVGSVSVGDFSSSDSSVDRISIRGSSMVSTFDDSYSEYIERALQEQLQQAALWDDASSIIITGTLLENAFDASGFSIGESDIKVNFVVIKDDREIYNKNHSIHHEWDSSFVGAIAIPNAQQNYPIAVQKLITAFLTDPELIDSIKN